MNLELRIEQIGDEHIEPYVNLSRAEYGDSAAVSLANHLRWKFLENPQGPSVGVHLYEDRELVARIAVQTRQFLHRGKLYKAAHMMDFLVHPKRRGIESLLQLIDGLKQLSGFDFLFIMAPNPAGAAVWDKLVKMPRCFDLNLAVAPLRPAALLQSAGKFRSGVLAPLLDWPWRQVVGGASWLRGCLNHVQIETDWPKPAEFERMLSGDWGDRVVGLRSAEYLEWRYRRSPVFRYKVFFLREKGLLSGYFVARRTVHDGVDCLFVVDAFGLPQLTSASWQAVSLAEVSRASVDGAEMAMVLGNTEWGALSAVNGLPFLTIPPHFLPRNTKVYAQWVAPQGFDIRRDNFYVTLGDSDVI